MQEFELSLKAFLGEPAVAFVGYCVGLIGLVLSIYSIRKNPFSKRIYYRMRGLNIINKKAGDISSLQIRFAQSDISILSETTLIFWNGGNAAITSDDIPDKSPIAVQVPQDHQILAVTVLENDGPSVVMSISEDLGHSELPILISLLERGRGALIRILHTCPNPLDVRMSGSITDFGAPRLKKRMVSLKVLLDFVAYSLMTLSATAVFWNAVNVFQTKGLFGAIAALLLLGLLVFLVLLGLLWLIAKISMGVAKRALRPSSWEFEKAILDRVLVEMASK